MAALFKEHQLLLLYSETKEWSSKFTHFDWTLQKLDHLTGRHFDQINSLTIDDGPFEFDSESFSATCSKIISDARLQNVPLIPRDSHGLQVVMDDLRSLPAVEPLFSKDTGNTWMVLHSRWANMSTSEASNYRLRRGIYLQDQFRSRRDIYVASVHKAAYFLHPLNSGKTLNPIDRAEVLTFLRGSTPESQQSLVERSSDRFRAREFEFDRPDLWDIAEDSELFWTQMVWKV